MEAKNNMKQAMYEMFGVGNDQTEENITTETVDKKTASATVIAAGAVFEGNIYSEGNVDIFGSFKGNITAKGVVKVGGAHDGDITAGSLELFAGEINGDVTAVDKIIMRKGTKLCGNITAKEFLCAGELEGNISVSKDAVIESTAKVIGNISADSVSVAKGAFIKGSIDVKAASAPRNIVAAARPVQK
ncbi:MAG: polymer-forming cytoskeletal protein [Oscillospiraceae bacterium]|nr:polymer-forming cytoskeletal protein [Oscillospiraceae bacterium]